MRAILDVICKNRAVAFDGRPETGCTLALSTEYIDAAKKRRYRELEAEPFSVRFPDTDRRPQAWTLDRPDHIRKAQSLRGFVQENPPRANGVVVSVKDERV